MGDVGVDSTIIADAMSKFPEWVSAFIGAVTVSFVGHAVPAYLCLGSVVK